MPASRDVAGDPPESTQLRIGDEVTWSDINGVYDRDNSLKENTNPKCLLNNHHHQHHTPSQRFSGNLKPTAAPIIGLSGGNLGGGARRHHHHHHARAAMFPKRSTKTGNGGGGQGQAKASSAVAVPEPGSPRVSCFGKVGSEERDRERALRRLPPPSSSSPGRCSCGGLGLLLMTCARRGRSRSSAVECVVDRSPAPLPTLPASVRGRKGVAAEAEAAVPGMGLGLGAMRRFSSVRRAADWVDEVEGDGRVARSGPL